MSTIHLRPTVPEQDFEQIAALFTSENIEQTSKTLLMADYAGTKDRIICLTTSENGRGEFLGFTWAVRSSLNPNLIHCYLVVKPEHRNQGVGSRLYGNLLQAVESAEAKILQVSFDDTCLQCRAFAERRGFIEKSHDLAMSLDLTTFNDLSFDEIIVNLKSSGFHFTTMEEMGNTVEAQRQYYCLNESTGMDMPGSEGERSWLSFEDYQEKVCQAAWYDPAGQMFAIDMVTGAWAGMSAITRFEGSDHAYNLHTGVDRRYRGRKLGQTVKIHALRYAREVLQVHEVRTHHNSLNLPIIAIDRKFGYIQMSGTFTMVKELK